MLFSGEGWLDIQKDQRWTYPQILGVIPRLLQSARSRVFRLAVWFFVRVVGRWHSPRVDIVRDRLHADSGQRVSGHDDCLRPRDWMSYLFRFRSGFPYRVARIPGENVVPRTPRNYSNHLMGVRLGFLLTYIKTV